MLYQTLQSSSFMQPFWLTELDKLINANKLDEGH